VGRLAHRPQLSRPVPAARAALAPAPRPVVIVAGPTASGKSALARDIARRFGGVVVNADSMQVYRELRVLTARPSAEDEAAVPHRLYGILPAAEICSAARWRSWALAEIASAHRLGGVAIVTGGTGLYLRALERGLSPIPEIPAEIRSAMRRRLAELGNTRFHAELARRDLEMAGRLAPGDSQRLLRAAEVLAATGVSLAQWQRQAPGVGPGFAIFTLVVLPPRPALHEEIEARFKKMLSAGAVEEVRRLVALALDPSLPAMKAHGVPELTRHLAGQSSLEEAARSACRVTRHYAKRQFTWLRHQLAQDYVLEERYGGDLPPTMTNKIGHFLLTGHR
jgi:tRNA dimethylallyltransferase